MQTPASWPSHSLPVDFARINKGLRSHSLLALATCLTFMASLPASWAGSTVSTPSSAWPAYSFQIKPGIEKAGGSISAPASRSGADAPELNVSVVSVPAEEEAGLVREMVRRSARDSGSDQVLIAYSGHESFAQELDASHQANAGRVVPYRLPEAHTPRRKFSLSGVERAGTWVAVAGTGIASTMLYISMDIEPATAGAMVIAFLTTLNVRFQPVMLAYLDGAMEIGKSVSERVFPGREMAKKAGGEIGTLKAAFLYHFLTNGVLKLALNLGDVSKTFGTAAVMNDLLTMSAFNVLSSSTWDMAFAKMVRRNQGDEAKKVVRLFSYANRMFLMAVTPFVFLPQTYAVGMSIYALYGTVGVVANFKDQAFFHAAETVVARMENSRSIDRVLAALQRKSLAPRRPVLSCAVVFQ